jgi:hypothetical protein
MKGAAVRGWVRWWWWSSASSLAPRSRSTPTFTDRDRVWVNFTREAAVVGDKALLD